jgi:hypothetical protein
MKISRVVAVLLFGFGVNTGLASPPVDKGVLNLQQESFEEKISLNGHWLFFEQQLLTPAQCQQQRGSVVHFPQTWNSLRSDGTGTGYGTYFLKIIAPASRALALEVPQLYSSYTLWVNNEVAGQNGKVGTSAQNSTPQWLPQVVNLPLADTLLIALQISNFQHHTGGVKEPLFIGERELMHRKHKLAIQSVFLEVILLTVLAFGTLLFLYVRAESKKIIFYFSMLCLSWAIRSLVSNLYPAIQLVPDFNWSIMVKIEYVTLFFTMIWGILFLSRLFPNESHKPIKYTLVTINSLLIALTILTQPIFFTQWLNLYLILCGVLLIYAMIMIVIALLNERVGVWLLVSSIFLGLLVFSYDVLSFEGVFQYYPVVFSISYIAIFSLMNIALLFHLKIFKSRGTSNALTFDDLYKDQGFKYK